MSGSGAPNSGVYVVVAVLVVAVLLAAAVLVGSLLLSPDGDDRRPLAPASPTATPLG